MKKLSRSVIIIVFLIFAFVLLKSSIVSTYNDEYKLILQFGKVVKVIDEPGLSFKIPFIQSTQSIPNYEMIYDLVPSEVNTRDKKVMVTDSFALWSVTDPLEYLSRLGANKANAESRISVVVYNAVKNVISSTDQADVISGRDGKLAQMITDKIGDSLDSYGITVKKVETKMLDLPDSNKESVYQRMIAERNNISATYAAEGEKEAAILRADAKRIALMSEAEGTAEAIKKIIDAKPDAAYLTLQGFEALKALASSESTKIVIPSELQNITGLLTSMKEVIGDKESKKNK